MWKCDISLLFQARFHSKTCENILNMGALGRSTLYRKDWYAARANHIFIKRATGIDFSSLNIIIL